MRFISSAIVALNLYSTVVLAQSLVVVQGKNNQVVVMDSQNVVRVDARQWHYTDARQWHNTLKVECVTRVAVVPVEVVRVDDCREVRLCVVISRCGRSFRTIIGGREVTFDLLSDRGYSTVYSEYRERKILMSGRLWRASDGLLYFTSSCPDGITRTWRDP